MIERQKVVDLLLKVSRRQIDPRTITDHTRLIEDLLFDSVEIVQLITELEESFNIVFSFSDLTDDILVDIFSVWQYVLKKVEEVNSDK